MLRMSITLVIKRQRLLDEVIIQATINTAVSSNDGNSDFCKHSVNC